MAPGSDDDQPLPLRELARRAGISEGTLRNWVRHRGLQPRSRNDERRTSGVTLAELRAFCAANRRLPATKTVIAHLDHPAASLDTAELRVLLGAVVTAVRAATAAQLDLAQTTAGQAQDTATACSAHAAALTSALGGLDNALTRITPPTPDPG